MAYVAVWGRGDQGQLGLGGTLEDPFVREPCGLRRVPWRDDAPVQVCTADAHSVVLTQQGVVYVCGSNDQGQLGHDKNQSRFESVEWLRDYRIRVVACGAKHTLAVDQWGKLAAWGDDSRGQLGHNLGPGDPKPRSWFVKALGAHCVVQVAAGAQHSLVLTDTGKLFAFGDNREGQLGLGPQSKPFVSSPQPVECLSSLPIRHVACGGNHSIVVSVSGAVYAWGSNKHGQLGIGTNEDRPFPTQVRSLRSQRVCYVSCGFDFTVCLTEDGGVFSFGAGGFGQLGHGSRSDEHLPRKITELMGTEVSQIACGRRHTLAFVPSRGRLYAFGLGASGQLGRGNNESANTPQVVMGAWTNAAGQTLKRSFSDSGKMNNMMISFVAAGGEQSFAVLRFRDGSYPSFSSDMRIPSTESQVVTLTPSILSSISSQGDTIDDDLLERLERIFQSTAALNASLLKTDHSPCSKMNCGVDISAWRNAFSHIAKANESIRSIVLSSVTHFLIPKLASTPPDVETLRLFLSLPLYHEFDNVSNMDVLQLPFVKHLVSLAAAPLKVVSLWLSEREEDYLRPLVNVYKCVIVEAMQRGHEAHLKQMSSNATRSVSKDDFTVVAKPCFDFLGILHDINVSRKLIMDYEFFYIPEVNKFIDLPQSYANWLMAKSRGEERRQLHICNYPFVFNAEAKTTLLQVDQVLQMQKAVIEAQSQIALHQFFFQSDMVAQLPFLWLHVSRERLVDDTLSQIRQVSSADLKKPLRVQFQNEEAEDAGGVTKEFFMLLMRELLDPKFGMFVEYEETRSIWFHPNCFEEDVMFFLIGVICGLAIYNHIIILLPFPLVLYTKLLNERVCNTPLDLAQLSPTTAKSLYDLIAYEGEDIEDVFGLDFTITREVFGEVQSVHLKENGDKCLVNQDNKREYVELYCDFVLNKAVQRQFNAFQQGFHKVCGGRVMDLFHARELRDMVVGNENYDWEELEECTEYKNGYSKDDPTIRNFWSVFHELSEEDKRKFLLFLTGSDRIPILGMKSLRLTIQKTADDAFLPVAHTCFNLLDLPNYATREKLKYKLLKAIQHTTGFGLV